MKPSPPILHHKPFCKLVDEFSESLQIRGYNRGDKSFYPACVSEFLAFCEKQGIRDVDSIKATHVMDFHAYLEQRPNFRRAGGLSDSMIKHFMYSLRLFWDYLNVTEVTENSPAHLPKFYIPVHPQRVTLTLDEIKRLYDACENLKDRAILAVFYGAALRRSEGALLQIQDVVFSTGILNVRDGKYRKKRVVPLSNNVLSDIKAYIIEERIYQHPPPGQPLNNALFLNNEGRRMAGQYLNKRVKQLAEKASLNRDVSLHCLRRSIATHLADSGADMRFIQSFLGHSCADSTDIYAKRRKQQNKIIAALH